MVSFHAHRDGTPGTPQRSQARGVGALAVLSLAALLAAAPPAAAQGAGLPPEALSTEQMLEPVRTVAQSAAAEVSRQTPGVRVEVEVGTFDSRLRLAPCRQTEAFLPPGTRLWGASRIGLRCSDGAARWQVFIPVRVRAWAPALVAALPLPTGHALTEADVQMQDVDLAAEIGGTLSDASQAVGRTLLVPMKAGQTLRLTNLKPRQWFAPGETVTLEAQGPGFSITGEGVALNAGLDGQTVRVRTESGRVVTGVATGPRRVVVRP